jgi:hypothetical protein
MKVPMSRPEAVAALQKMTRGLSPNMSGMAKLLERIARHEEAQVLRFLLIEEGAKSLLTAEQRRKTC